MADEMSNEAVRKPVSNSLSVSPCLRTLRVSRPEAQEEREAFHHVEKKYNHHVSMEWGSKALKSF